MKTFTTTDLRENAEFRAENLASSKKRVLEAERELVEAKAALARDTEAHAKATAALSAESDFAMQRAACGCIRPDYEGHVYGCKKHPWIPAPTIGGAR